MSSVNVHPPIIESTSSASTRTSRKSRRQRLSSSVTNNVDYPNSGDQAHEALLFQIEHSSTDPPHFNKKSRKHTRRSQRYVGINDDSTPLHTEEVYRPQHTSSLPTPSPSSAFDMFPSQTDLPHSYTHMTPITTPTITKVSPKPFINDNQLMKPSFEEFDEPIFEWKPQEHFHGGSIDKARSSEPTMAQNPFGKDQIDDGSTATFTLGVAGAVVGTILMGPVGLLVGAACVGIGIGVMQIPEEERTKLSNKATVAINRMKESAISANDAVGSSCATVCNSPELGLSNGDRKERYEPTSNVGANAASINKAPTFSPSFSNISANTGVNTASNNFGRTNIDEQGKEINRQGTFQTNSYPCTTRVAPACCRITQRITPVSQIHSLDPSLHPRAWLEIMASSWTSADEKNEAMEEILILSKDKIHAKMLLEEGILDSLMYIIMSFFRSHRSGSVPVEAFMADPSYFHAKLAASCCVALGKAHWAIAYTEVDRSYNHGSVHVPIERQIAQMLLEIPHHVVSEIVNREEIFKLFDLGNDETQHLAKSIGALAEGRVELHGVDAGNVITPS